MPKLESALKRLASGCFVCAYHYPEEFAALVDDAGRRDADAWLRQIGYRLAQLTEGGAFFMAHAIVTTEMRAGLREEMRTIRSRLSPIVGLLETLRQSQGRDPHIHPGDVLWESEISEAVRASTMMEGRLAEMREIVGARASDSTSDRVRRMLEHLEKEGYIVETNALSKGYQVTGKVDYLYQLIGFIAANMPQLSDEDVVDQIDPQERLVETQGPQIPDVPAAAGEVAPA